jgi:hypothetical protein
MLTVIVVLLVANMAFGLDLCARRSFDKCELFAGEIFSAVFPSLTLALSLSLNLNISSFFSLKSIANLNLDSIHSNLNRLRFVLKLF